MPDDRSKDSTKDGRGFLLLPREWEGLHEAFPEFPAQVDSRSPLLPSTGSVVYGAIGGVLYNSYRALRGKPLKHAVLSGIGLVSLPLTVLGVVVDEIGRSTAKDDVKAILKADNIPLPKRQLIKRVNGETYDKWSLLGGMFGMAGLLIYRKAPNIPKFSIMAWVGAFTAGQVVGKEMHMKVNAHDEELFKGLAKYQQNLEKASSIYTTRTGKEPNPYLYGALGAFKQLDQTFQNSKTSSSWSSFPAFGGGIAPGAAAMELPEGHPEVVTAQPVPEGSKPHMGYVDSNGKEMILAQRDFDFNPENKATGLEALQDHLEDLQKHRRAAVSSAQYLWELIAKREAAHYKPWGRDQESEPINLEKKALELLSSIHKQHYSQIADIDWCIANTQKLILQMQSDGKWLPTKSDLSGNMEARGRLLNNIRTHKKNLEVQNSTLESTLAVSPFENEDKDEIRRGVADNLKATAKLLEDLESGADDK